MIDSMPALGRRRSVARHLAWAGCAFLFVVVLTHVAERFHILPAMGWGLPDSPGHYLDLVSAIIGVSLLLCALGVRWLPKRDSN